MFALLKPAEPNENRRILLTDPEGVLTPKVQERNYSEGSKIIEMAIAEEPAENLILAFRVRH